MAQNSFIISIFTLFSLIIFSSCSEDKTLEEEKFIKVYVDLLIAQDTTSGGQLSLDSIQTLVFNKHGITEKEYLQTIDRYNSAPKNWETFFDKATAYVEKLKREGEH